MTITTHRLCTARKKGFKTVTIPALYGAAVPYMAGMCALGWDRERGALIRGNSLSKLTIIQKYDKIFLLGSLNNEKTKYWWRYNYDDPF